MGKAADYIQGLNESISNAIKRVTPFRARAHAIVDGKVQIQQYGSDAPLSEAYARLAGTRINPNDEVAVVMLGETPFVLGRIIRDDTTGETYAVPLTIEDTNFNAFVVRNDGGQDVFRVNTIDNYAYLFNGGVLSGHAVGGAQHFWIGANGGSAWFAGDVNVGNGLVVGGKGFNAAMLTPPVYGSYSQNNADVGSTTNTATPQVAITRTITLPAGTWDVWLMGGGHLRHSAGGLTAFQVNCNGSTGGQHVMTFYADSYGQGTSNALFNGVGGGNVTIKFEYRASAAGTVTCRNPFMIMNAVRTA